MSDGSRVRSPNYPAFSLKEAVDKIGTLYRALQRNPAPREVIAKGLGYNSLNGASATAISALNKYGLLEGRGEDLRVSDRAMSILNPLSKEERVDAIRAAAKEPRLFAELAERFPDGVTNEELLRNYLLRNGFAISAVTSAIQAYRDTSEFVSQEAGSYTVPSTPKRDPAPMHATNTPVNPVNPSPLPPTVVAEEDHDNARVVHRMEFQDGSFVELRASWDVDASFALSVVETSLPGWKLVTELEEKRRKAIAERQSENTTGKKEE